jgi:hypothetical protein|tara:strand:- start:81 stop:458 length:378 start_codon:yes stop_codon:yes gene_type:complete
MTIESKERIRVHKNLNTGQWVIRRKIKGVGWRVHSNQVSTVALSNAVPIVSEKGAIRIKAKGQREVIACIEGDFNGYDLNSYKTGESIHYNPFRDYRFTYETGKVWDGASLVIFEPQGSTFKEGI